MLRSLPLQAGAGTSGILRFHELSAERDSNPDVHSRSAGQSSELQCVLQIPAPPPEDAAPPPAGTQEALAATLAAAAAEPDAVPASELSEEEIKLKLRRKKVRGAHQSGSLDCCELACYLPGAQYIATGSTAVTGCKSSWSTQSPPCRFVALPTPACRQFSGTLPFHLAIFEPDGVRSG